MNPKVSIVMPVYNCEKYLNEAVESILNQSYSNLELICVDDGSTDDSLNILHDLQSKDKRISIVKQNNSYAGVARNNGFAKATGKYVMFLDSDDVFEKKMIQHLVKVAENNDTDIVFFGFYHFSKSIKRRSMMGIPFTCKGVTSAKDHCKDLFQIGQGVPWNRFYRVDFVKQTGLQFQAIQSNNDVFFSKAIMLYADRMMFLKKRFVNYRVSNASSLQGSYKLSSGNFAKCLEALRDEILKMNLYDKYKETFEKYVLESFLLTFKKAVDLDTFETICRIEKESLLRMDINCSSKTVLEHVCHEFFACLIENESGKALFALYRYLQENYISKNAIESRIGRKLLSILKIKIYE